MKRFFTRKLHDVREGFTPIATVPTFKENGHLTPQEFLTAGDNLAKKWTFWQWKDAGHSEYRKTYLPDGKQYLSTVGIVSTYRYNDVQHDIDDEDEINDNSINGDLPSNNMSRSTSSFSSETQDLWVMSSNLKTQIKDVQTTQNTEPIYSNQTDTSDQSCLNANLLSEMQSSQMVIDDNGIQEDDMTIDTMSSESTINEYSVTEEDDPHRATLLSVKFPDQRKSWRYYDLHITYDNYYRTPRLWIIGYDAWHNLLTPQEIFEDISPEHSMQTVTLEEHPFLNKRTCLSVHPCQHAKMLKNLSRHMGNKFKIDDVLELFLKVMVTVLPTADFLAIGMQ